MPVENSDIARDVRIAARALGRHGLVHAYGHCSARIDAKTFLVCPSRPMGLIEPSEVCTQVQVEGPLPGGVLGEVRLHQHIYKNRPEIGGLVRFMSPNMMSLVALGITPKPRHGFGTYFAPSPPLWDDPQLIRDDEKAFNVVAKMGNAPAVMMRGNGAVTAGETLKEAVVLAWYLEDACRVELDALASGLSEFAPIISDEEAMLRATKAGNIFERMWEYLSAGDPEI
ncbi:MAG: class II aldolase/adducin family protein [Rhizobiaceae bacterium]